MLIKFDNPIITYTDDSESWRMVVTYDPTMSQPATVAHTIINLGDMVGGDSTNATMYGLTAAQGDWQVRVWEVDGEGVAWEIICITSMESSSGYNMESLGWTIATLKASRQGAGSTWTAASLDNLRALIFAAKADVESRGIHWTTIGD